MREKNKILESSHLLCRQLFDEVPCYISVQNRDRRIVRANRQFKLDFGSCLGERCYEIYKHRTHPCPQCPVEESFRDGMIHQTEEVVTTRGGKQKIVLTLTAPLKDENGEINEVMELATDITQIRELQDRLTSLGCSSAPSPTACAACSRPWTGGFTDWKKASRTTTWI